MQTSSPQCGPAARNHHYSRGVLAAGRSRSLAIVLMAASLAAAACDSDTSSGPSRPTPTELVALLAPASLTVGVGDSAQIRATASLLNGSNELVTTSGSWQSSDPAVATVDASGIVRGVTAGTTQVTVTRDTLTATVNVAVSAGATPAMMLSGAAAAPGADTATVTLTIDASGRALATVYFASTVVDLVGRLDAPAGIVHVTGGGYSLFGTLDGDTLTGTLTDPSGRTGTFAALDSTHMAVTPYCGRYTSGSGDGSFALALSVTGRTAGASAPEDGSEPLTFTGQRSGDSLAMSSDRGTGANGAVQGGAITGSFETAAGAAGDFTTSASGCH